jgi:esterase/lipase
MQVTVPQIWFRNEIQPCLGVVLLYHGLNNRPELMHPIAKSLSAVGYSVMVPILTGHLDSYKEFKKITNTNWQNDVALAYSEAEIEAQKERCDLYYIGFSLGGLLGTLLKAQGKLPAVKKMCLLAPAIETTFFASLLKPLLFFNLDISIPSKAPGFYRAHKRLPIQAYRAFFDTKDQLQSVDNQLADIPTIIYIDKKDELVSYKKVSRFVQRNKLVNWSINILDSKESKCIHHMIADPFYTGKVNWANILEGTIAFFKKEY